MNLIEIFPTIQGEGRFVGQPVTFIRLAGCNLNCNWCDTKYSWGDGEEVSVQEIVSRATKYGLSDYVITGGEPLAQINELEDLLKALRKETDGEAIVHLETNGSITSNVVKKFDYVTFSPKTERDAKKVTTYYTGSELFFDVKIVTDLDEMNIDLLPYATMLMPLTTEDKELNSQIQNDVWEFCTEHGLNYSPRLQTEIDERVGYV